MTRARLIVNADDFGMSRGITDGVILAHRYGYLTSASLMVNMPAAEYAVARLANATALGVGVHLNICQGRPILPAREVPSLVDADGRFHPPPVMIRKLWTWQAAGREIEAEFRAQIRWAKDHGVLPTHADSHHHLHIYPAAVMPFVGALVAEGVRCARAPRSTVWPRSGVIGGPHEGSTLRRVCVQVYRGALQRGAFRRLHMPASRISFLSRDRHDLAALGERWKAAIAGLPSGTFELSCHPGLFERGFSEADPIHLQREEELHWLTDRAWIDVVRRSGVELISYESLAGSPDVLSAANEAPALQ
ncbi:MAG TPA: ChbG/HpnK family deacetylase [Candidatus Acidoferrales bacterium]|nr:ChbG/HpnK family deacetylase [Candidatus Acidoferrales bacterium]